MNALNASADQHLHGTVRKRLDEDCMLGDQLHPSIAERLARVRELPVRTVANFCGVERDRQGVWLVWQFIDGQNLETFCDAAPTAQQRERVAQELRLAVDSLHAHGIVHGALHARNVIVNPQGHVHLTHISPLLYSDPSADQRALHSLLSRLCPESECGRAEAESGRVAETESVRWRAYLAAFAALLVGLLIFVAILWYIHS